ncbi:alpha/beta hydrolase [Haematomicrobium sanguinis]|uniref:alpha/beta hydrolase n=1 Tax=Haematomicrobium sanguinis TaxID=479106 RepID=UPI00055636CD|nr:phospholipase [Haematomicrobium sanguinis]
MSATDILYSRQPAERAGTNLVIGFHGYGSSEEKLRALFDFLPENTTLALPRGPFDVGGDFGWFLLDYFLTPDFTAVLDATQKAFTVVDSIIAASSYRSVSALGYSQGMAMTTTLHRLRPELFTCVVGLSGFVIRNDLLGALEPMERKIPFFWGRDVGDLVINEDAIYWTEEWLEANTQLTARTYPGMGHNLGLTELMDVQVFLKRYLS